jgi:hypothetical protein
LNYKKAAEAMASNKRNCRRQKRRLRADLGSADMERYI